MGQDSSCQIKSGQLNILTQQIPQEVYCIASLVLKSSRSLTTFVGAFVGKGVGALVGGHKLGSHSENTIPPEPQDPRFEGFPLFGKQSSLLVQVAPLVG